MGRASSSRSARRVHIATARCPFPPAAPAEAPTPKAEKPLRSVRRVQATPLACASPPRSGSSSRPGGHGPVWRITEEDVGVLVGLRRAGACAARAPLPLRAAAARFAQHLLQLDREVRPSPASRSATSPCFRRAGEAPTSRISSGVVAGARSPRAERDARGEAIVLGSATTSTRGADGEASSSSPAAADEKSSTSSRPRPGAAGAPGPARSTEELRRLHVPGRRKLGGLFATPLVNHTESGSGPAPDRARPAVVAARSPCARVAGSPARSTIGRRRRTREPHAHVIARWSAGEEKDGRSRDPQCCGNGRASGCSRGVDRERISPHGKAGVPPCWDVTSLPERIRPRARELPSPMPDDRADDVGASIRGDSAGGPGTRACRRRCTGNATRSRSPHACRRGCARGGVPPRCPE